MWSMNYVCTTPVPVFFLILDRCFVLNSSISFSKNKRLTFTYTTIFFILIIYIIGILISIDELPLQYDKSYF